MVLPDWTKLEKDDQDAIIDLLARELRLSEEDGELDEVVIDLEAGYEKGGIVNHDKILRHRILFLFDDLSAGDTQQFDRHSMPLRNRIWLHIDSPRRETNNRIQRRRLGKYAIPKWGGNTVSDDELGLHQAMCFWMGIAQDGPFASGILDGQSVESLLTNRFN